MITLLFSGLTLAQKVDATYENDPAQRIRIAPESVFTMFREAGMKPVDHKLTPVQKEKVRRAFTQLPSLHQRLLRQHLQSISFMDNMPNTALTSPVDSGDGPKRFYITFRAGLLNETISEWASWKENTCFKQTSDSSYAVRAEGGNLDAILYVLLHEATHVVDAVMNITPRSSDRQALVESTPFTNHVWRTMNVPDDRYLDSLLEKTRFRSGQPMPISLAPDVYRKLMQTPFPSLYGMTAWSEDIAELVTI
ncbi:hypothetical protein [Spirosoma sp. KNUC1025]|uniref:hypothetical protein n=1 Tax=Spirosoma sp. KNUC1025 TaxID=2894082 RepID=UPI00386A55EA|nr:hypothetical protein LN737_31385 [Spirosoma sp. KNUC1025]